VGLESSTSLHASSREVKREATEQAKADALQARAAVETARAEAKAAMEEISDQQLPSTAMMRARSATRESRLSMIGSGPPVWETEARPMGTTVAGVEMDLSAEMAAAIEAHETLTMAVPGIIAPPVSARRAAADPMYAALKGVLMDSGRSEFGV
tara:strand:+ start:67 stop:528 length:462 start_codon:yes stop_codon:yes gene_type:complete